MARAAILEYFTSDAGTLLFLVVPGRDQPLVYEVREGGTGRPLSRRDLRLRVERLLVDFHGLPPDWDQGSHAEWYADVLALPPAVHPLKRRLPLWSATLLSPAFSYGLQYLEELSPALLPAECREHLHDVGLLCVVPHGPLHSLPFAALRWSPDEYLVERFGIAYSPSATVLRYCRRKNRSRGAGPRRSPARCLVAAVAAQEDEDPDNVEGDVERLGALFEGHGASVRRLVGAGRGGTPPATAAELGRGMAAADVVHLACHGVFGEAAGSGALDGSGLLLSDGAARPALHGFAGLSPEAQGRFLLSARDVFRFRLEADLVSLRACSSGRSALAAGDELLGLTRAFLYAGTPSLLATLWDVSKTSSRRIFDSFYQAWADPARRVPKWRALQAAQREMLAEPPGSAYRHPYHWAPFALIGDWV